MWKPSFMRRLEESPTERLLNPQQGDRVLAVFHDGANTRMMRYCDLPKFYEWENDTSFGDTFPVFTAGKEIRPS